MKLYHKQIKEFITRKERNAYAAARAISPNKSFDPISALSALANEMASFRPRIKLSELVDKERHLCDVCNANRARSAHSADYRLFTPKGNQILEDCRGMCDAFIDMINTSIQRLKPIRKARRGMLKEQGQIHDLDRQSDDIIHNGQRLLIAHTNEITRAKIAQTISKLSDLKSQRLPSSMISLRALAEEERRLCEAASHLLEEDQLTFDPAQLKGDQVLEVCLSKCAEIVAKIDPALRQLKGAQEVDRVHCRLLDCQQQIHHDCESMHDFISASEHSLISASSEESPEECIPDKISALSELKSQLSDSRLISLSKLAETQGKLCKSANSLIQEHKLPFDSVVPIDDRILEAARAACAAFTDKIDQTIAQLKVRMEANNRQSQVSEVQQRIRNFQQGHKEFVSRSREFVTDALRGVSLEKIHETISTLSELKISASESRLNSLVDLSKEEKRLCEETNTLIREYSLLFPLLNPIGYEILNDCRSELSILGDTVTTTIHQLTLKLEEDKHRRRVSECQQQITNFEQEMNGLQTSVEQLLSADSHQKSVNEIGKTISTLSQLRPKFSESTVSRMIQLLEAEQQLCETANNFFRSNDLSHQVIEPIGDKILEDFRCRRSTVIAKIDSEIPRLQAIQGLFRIFDQFSKAQTQINLLHKQKADFISRNGGFVQDAAGETSPEKIPERISQLSELKLTVSENELTSLSELVANEKQLSEDANTLIGSHKLNYRRFRPIGDQVLTDCQQSCSAFTHKIDSAIHRLKATQGVHGLHAKILACQTEFDSRSRDGTQLLANAARELEAASGTIPPAEIGKTKDKLSARKSELSPFTFDSLSTIADLESAHCERQAGLIVAHSLDIRAIQPILGQRLEDLRAALNELDGKIAARIGELSWMLNSIQAHENLQNEIESALVVVSGKIERRERNLSPAILDPIVRQLQQLKLMESENPGLFAVLKSAELESRVEKVRRTLQQPVPVPLRIANPQQDLLAEKVLNRVASLNVGVKPQLLAPFLLAVRRQAGVSCPGQRNISQLIPNLAAKSDVAIARPATAADIKYTRELMESTKFELAHSDQTAIFHVLGALAQQIGIEYVIVRNPDESFVRGSMTNSADSAMTNGIVTESSLFLLDSPFVQHHAKGFSVRLNGGVRELEANQMEMDRFNAEVREKLASIEQIPADELPIVAITEGSRIVHTPIHPRSAIAKLGAQFRNRFGSAYLDHVVHPAFGQLRIHASLFCKEWNRDYRIPGGCPVNEKRGGVPYCPPNGWVRYAISVLGKFSDDIWIGCKNGPGEWQVAYHGTSPVNIQAILSGSLKAGPGCSYGKGIYCSPDPEVAATYSARKPLPLKVGNETKKVIMMLMCRVNPRAICQCSKLNRIGTVCPKAGNNDFTLHKPTDKVWFVNADNANSSNIRVYGILIKEGK